MYRPCRTKGRGPVGRLSLRERAAFRGAKGDNPAYGTTTERSGSLTRTSFNQGRSNVAESLQHKVDGVRRPRVQITYDVETGGAMKKTELPFVVGVLADLSGQPKQPLKQLKERKAVYIDRDNFNDVLNKSGARLALR